MTKDEWIQRAKALLFDCAYDLESEGLRREAWDLIEQGGGYDAHTETPTTPLRWPEGPA